MGKTCFFRFRIKYIEDQDVHNLTQDGDTCYTRTYCVEDDYDIEIEEDLSIDEKGKEIKIMLQDYVSSLNSLKSILIEDVIVTEDEDIIITAENAVIEYRG